LQTAIAALVKKELVGRSNEGEYRVMEPFFAEWLEREQLDYRVDRTVRGDQLR
jgi:hypothetical protein